MTQDIRLLHEEILKEYARLGVALSRLQEACSHENATHVNKADTGNYCKDDDVYWTDHNCPDCGKYWQTDQNWDRV